MDETYVRAKGRWCYLYRAIDSAGATIDFLLSAFRDADAAKRLFRKALGDRRSIPSSTWGDVEIHMIRKEQVRWVTGEDFLRQIRFIDSLFEFAA